MKWVILILVGISMGVARSEVSVVVDSASGLLVVRGAPQGDIALRNLALGRFGVTRNKGRGDNMTPLGRYRVAWIATDGRFGSFIGINYPGIADAERGYRLGIINAGERAAIIKAHTDGRVPPQDTALGGYLGIHGLGRGDSEMHRLYNWTRGCIALSNPDMRQLLELLEVGDPVEIR